MATKGKKTAIIVVSLLVIIGVGIYAFVKRKKDTKNEMPTNPNDETGSTAPNPSVVASLPVAPSLPPPSPTESSRPLVSATSLLAGNLKAGVNKGLYANFDGLLIYSLDNKLAFKSKKGQRLGTIYNATQAVQGNIMIYFIGVGGVKYKTVAAGMSIK
jgi:hypothetical protein